MIYKGQFFGVLDVGDIDKMIETTIYSVDNVKLKKAMLSEYGDLYLTITAKIRLDYHEAKDEESRKRILEHFENYISKYNITKGDNE